MLLRSGCRLWASLCNRSIPIQAHSYRNTAVHYASKQGPPRPKVREEDLEEAFLKGSGPGGQKINKTTSAVQLKHKPTGIVVKSQATRSKSQNRKIAREILAEKVDFREKGAASRVAIKAEVASKKKASKSKKSRRKYRALKEEAKDGTQDQSSNAIK